MDNYIITIGKRIRQIRKEKKYTINVIAKKANVSNGLVSRIENGRTIPSLPVLFALIGALETDIPVFFKNLSTQSKKPFLVFRKDTKSILEKEEQTEGFTYQHIFSKQFPITGFECVLLDIKPQAKRDKVTTDAFEYKYIISGQCSYQIGEDQVDLTSGDSLFFDGRIPHVPINCGTETARMLVVYFYIEMK